MNLTNEQIQQILDGAPDGATHCTDTVPSMNLYAKVEHLGGFYVSLSNRWEPYPIYAGIHLLSDLREILTLRQEVERLKGHFDKCTGLPASVGICEPVEGYAEEPYFLHSAVKGMAEKIKQLESQQSEVAARAVEDAVMNTPTHKMKVDERLYHSQRALLDYANQLREQGDE